MALPDDFLTWFFIIILFSNILFPSFILGKQSWLSGKQLSERNPEYGNLRFGYNVLLIFVMFFIIICCTLTFPGQERRSMLVIVILPASWLLLHGLTARITGVFPGLEKTQWDIYVVDEDGSLRWLANTEIAVAIVEILLVIALLIILK